MHQLYKKGSFLDDGDRVTDESHDERITKNLAHISGNMSDAAIKSGRKPEDIVLIGVTKSVSPECISQLITAGVSNLGENRVQDFLPKYEAIGRPRPNWHFIGHLQRNKVKFIIDKVVMIHSLDNLSLAIEIDKRAAAIGRTMDVLVEVNIADEDTKHGIKPEDTISFADKLGEYGNIRLKGLMCIAPFVENPEDNRVYFEKMRNLFLDIKSHDHHNLTELSMGMSGDYAVAIEEGATMVRIGTALVS